MLITESTIKPNSIVTFKFIGGDEVVAKVIEISEANYTVTKPQVVLMAQQGFGFAPFVLTGDPAREILLSKTHIIAALPTHERVAKEYIKITTGIQL